MHRNVPPFPPSACFRAMRTVTQGPRLPCVGRLAQARQHCPSLSIFSIRRGKPSFILPISRISSLLPSSLNPPRSSARRRTLSRPPSTLVGLCPLTFVPLAGYPVCRSFRTAQSRSPLAHQPNPPASNTPANPTDNFPELVQEQPQK
ncbi:hypothetical protein K456DRAFT_625885 [Colletotrichum gloeosporioides 23]|nr:hypothetical protein K456DRAFT_625885 [Colletotrichum gloeosporioides 23]